MLAAARVARERIDMRRHEGEHPRMGALDVCPFVPVSGVTMDDCVACAREFGRRAGAELGVPIFLYEAAAANDYRTTLKDIREGEYEGLADKLSQKKWKPDFGPAEFVPEWGATATGARFFLIAFNVDLDTDDLHIAEDIARRIRASSGGLEEVKALGFRLPGRGTVQVSMNLTDFRKSSMGRVYRRIEELCRERSVEIRSSELIGLVPRAALVKAAEEFVEQVA